MKNVAGQTITTPGFSSGQVGTKYTYTNMGRVETATDERGVLTTYGYDDLGNIKTVKHQDDAIITYDRDYENNTLTVIDEENRTTRYEYNPFGYETLVWDETTNAQVSNKDYDKMFRLETEQGAAGTAIVTYGYDALGRMKSQIAKDNTGTLAHERYEYDDGNPLGQKVTTTIYGGKTGAPDQILVQYTDKMGNVVIEGRMNGSKEEVTTYGYDYIGRKTEEKTAGTYEKETIDEVTIPYTTKWEYTWDGQVAKQYNAKGQYISFTYTNTTAGKTVKSLDYAGSASTARYDDLGRLISEQTPVVNLNGTIHYAKTEYYYDRNGKPENLATVKKLVNEPGKSQKWQVTENYYNTRGFLTSTAMKNDANGYDTYSYTYDNVGRVRTMTDPLGRVTETVYTDAQRKETRTDPLKQTETILYNASGLPATKIDRNGVTHVWGYDGLGRETSYTAGDEYRSADYSQAGQLMTESNGTSTISYQYDVLGRVNYQKEASADGTVEQTYTYYADNQRKTAALTVGGAGKMTDYTYDRLGRLETVKADGQTAVYTYDANGNRDTLTVGNTVTAYDYNLANWLTSLENKVGGQVQSGYAYIYYLDGNQLTKTDTKTNQVVTYLYDLQGRLKEENYAGGVAGGGAVVYTYDTAGNRKSMTDTRSGSQVVTAYHYDANNRLEQTEKTASDGMIVAERFRYDCNGNQLSMMQEVLRPMGASVTPGLSLDGGVWEISDYDAFGRLTSVQNNKGGAAYTYNPTGLRHSKTADGVKSVHVWDGANMAAELVDGSLTWYRRGVNLLWSTDKSGKKSTYLYNGHGDVVALVGGTGSVTREYNYDAFGNQLEQGKPIAWELVDTSEDVNPFRYCGEYFDAETGSVYLRARYYRAGTGRFTQEDPHWTTHNMIYGDEPVAWNEQEMDEDDPLGLTTYTYVPDIEAILQSGNLYVYGLNNPSKYIDPSGNVAIIDDLIIIVIIIIAGVVYTASAAWVNSEEGQRAINAATEIIIDGISYMGDSLVEGIDAVASWASEASKSDPHARPGQKKQGREIKNKAREQPGFQDRSNKRNGRQPLPKHTPGRGHRNY